MSVPIEDKTTRYAYDESGKFIGDGGIGLLNLNSALKPKLEVPEKLPGLSVEDQLSLINSTSSPEKIEYIEREPIVIPEEIQQKRSGMGSRIFNNSGTKTSFADYERAVDDFDSGAAGKHMSLQEARQWAKDHNLNLTNTQLRTIRRGYNETNGGIFSRFFNKGALAFTDNVMSNYLNDSNRLDRKLYFTLDGKMLREGDEGYDAKSLENGNGFASMNDRNKAIQNWYDNPTNWSYNPTNGKLQVKAFTLNNGNLVADGNNVWDIDKNTYDSLGLTGNYEDIARNSLLLAYGKAVDTAVGSAAAPSTQSDLFKLLAYKGIEKTKNGKTYWTNDFNSMTPEERKTALDEIGKLAMEHYKQLASPNGITNWNSSVAADAWWKKLQSNFANDQYLKTAFSWDPMGRYATYAKGSSGPSGSNIGNLIGFRQGGNVQYFYKSGGTIVKALLGATLFKNHKMLGQAVDLGLSFIPGVNTLNLFIGYKQGNVSGKLLALAAGMDLLGPAAKLAKVAYNGYKVYKGAKGATKLVKAAEANAKTAKKSYDILAKNTASGTKLTEAQEALAAATNASSKKAAQRQLNQTVKNVESEMARNPLGKEVLEKKAASEAALKEAQTNAANAIDLSIRDALKFGWHSTPGTIWRPFTSKTGKLLYNGTKLVGGAANAFGLLSDNQQSSEDPNPQGSLPLAYTNTPTTTSENQGLGIQPGESLTDYWARSNGLVLWAATAKNGGTINMKHINYFQAGGVVAPQQASQGGDDIQAQVMQLVQAAMSGDLQATLTIELIMQAAQSGDLQAVQIAQLIQEVAKQMQGQAQAAKYGAKVAYLRKLKTGVNADEEVIYQKCGGKTVKKVVKKDCKGAKMKKGC